MFGLHKRHGKKMPGMHEMHELTEGSRERRKEHETRLHGLPTGRELAGNDLAERIKRKTLYK